MEIIFDHKGLGDAVPIKLTKEQREEIFKIQHAMPMLVFYGFRKLTPKIFRKRSIIICFENSRNWTLKKQIFINKAMYLVHVRMQNPGEFNDAKHSNRQWHMYEILVDEKPYNGNIDLVLEDNFLADQNNVSNYERQVIREKLKKEYYEFYKDAKPADQQALIFY